MEKRKKSIAVIDGQGGGIGSAMIKHLRENLAEEVEIIGLGTNAMATGAMLKAGANKGASGENAIVQTVKTVDVIIGTTGPPLTEIDSGNSGISLRYSTVASIQSTLGPWGSR